MKPFIRTILLPLILFGLFWIGRELYFRPDYAQGELMPPFEVVLLNGHRLTQSDLLGKYVLVDFWGSWCGPCRRESPELVALYNEFGRGEEAHFAIFSVGIERGKRQWTTAIQNDGLQWPWQYSGLKRFKDPLALQMGVREIPTKFLLDPQGRIIKVNPNFASIRDLLKRDD